MKKRKENRSEMGRDGERKRESEKEEKDKRGFKG